MQIFFLDIMIFLSIVRWRAKHYWNRIICLLQCPAKMAAGDQEQFQQLLTGLLSVENKVRQQAEVSDTCAMQDSQQAGPGKLRLLVWLRNGTC